MRRLEPSNVDMFAVERRSQWASVMQAYLNADDVARIWVPWPNKERPANAEMRSGGPLSITYVAHGDLSKIGANTAFGVAHRDTPDDNGLYHVVFDVLDHWSPQVFPGRRIYYPTIRAAIETRIVGFQPDQVTFDQFENGMLIQELQQFVTHNPKLVKRIKMFERTATHRGNWRDAEAFKAALSLGLVHSAYVPKPKKSCSSGNSWPTTGSATPPPGPFKPTTCSTSWPPWSARSSPSRYRVLRPSVQLRHTARLPGRRFSTGPPPRPRQRHRRPVQ